MAIWRTENALVLWGLETSPPTLGAPYGTPVVPNKRFGIHETVQAPDPEIDWMPFHGVGSSRNRSNILRGKWSLKGSVPDIRAQAGTTGAASLADVLALGLGRSVATVGGYTVYEGLTATDERLPSITMQIAMRDTDGNYSWIRDYFGGKVNRMTLSAQEGDDLKVSLDEIIFKDIAIGGSNNAFQGVTKYGSPDLGTDPGLNPKGRFLFAGASITVFGVEVCRVKRFSLTVDNQLDPKYYLCSDTPNSGLTQNITDLVEGKRSYTMSMDLDMVDTASDGSLFGFYLTQGGGPTGTTGITGAQMTMVFASSEGTNGGSIEIKCTPSAPTNTRPGTVMTGGRVDLPAPPAGYFAGQFQFNVDSVNIVVPS